MPESLDDSPESDAPEIARMRRIITEYESCEDPWLKSELLDTYGLTRDAIMNYRKIIARADLRASISPATLKGRAHPPRRIRVRRAPTAPSSRAYDTTRPGDSRRNRGVRNGVTVFIIIRIPRFPDTP
jgi:hypothetical protein